MILHFDTLHNRLQISGKIIFNAGFHVGARSGGFDPLACDNPVLRDHAGLPYIPGSSIRGVFRSRVESILRAIGGDAIRCCDPLADPCLNGDKIRTLREAAAEHGSERDSFMADAVYDASCGICRVFGNSFLASRVAFRDSQLDPDTASLHSEVRDGVAIDRDSETASKSKKFDFEVVNRDAEFPFAVSADNLDDIAYGLLCLGLREFVDGHCCLGGLKSRGLGAFRLKIDHLEKIESREDLLDYLISGQAATLDEPQVIRDYLDRHIAHLVHTIQGSTQEQ